jgi:hypothetical protein
MNQFNNLISLLANVLLWLITIGHHETAKRNIKRAAHIVVEVICLLLAISLLEYYFTLRLLCGLCG